MGDETIVFRMAPGGGKTLGDEQRLLDLLLKSDKVSFDIDRDVHREWIPPYGPDDFQLESGCERCCIRFDNGIAYFLNRDNMMRIYNQYTELKEDKNNGHR